MRYPQLQKNLHYHIYNRAISKRLIFKHDIDYRFFMYKISEFKQIHNILILVYCIMPNHFHLLLRSDNEAQNISKFMKSILQSYSRYFNKSRNHTGHVFEGRFCHKSVNNRLDMKKVKKYILDNPVKAGLVKKYYDWPYYWICPYL